jgi:hypothetical protein
MKAKELLTSSISYEYDIPYTRKPSVEKHIDKINEIIDRFNEIDEIQLRKGKVRYLETKRRK